MEMELLEEEEEEAAAAHHQCVFLPVDRPIKRHSPFGYGSE